MKNYKAEYKKIMAEEKEMYLGTNPKIIKHKRQTLHKRYMLWQFLYYFRFCQYLNDIKKDKSVSALKRFAIGIFYRFFDRKRNEYSYKSGVEIGIRCEIGKKCDIWHSGVVINGKIGENCTFRGNNVIGEKGGVTLSGETPVLGNGIDIGFGASVIGGIHIADNCVIGAGAVVTKSVDQEGAVLVGVPARIITVKEEN